MLFTSQIKVWNLLNVRVNNVSLGNCHITLLLIAADKPLTCHYCLTMPALMSHSITVFEPIKPLEGSSGITTAGLSFLCPSSLQMWELTMVSRNCSVKCTKTVNNADTLLRCISNQTLKHPTILPLFSQTGFATHLHLTWDNLLSTRKSDTHKQVSHQGLGLVVFCTHFLPIKYKNKTAQHKFWASRNVSLNSQTKWQQLYFHAESKEMLK